MTRQQERFVDEYILAGGNAATAAKNAGYKSSAAKVTGARLLKRPEIRQSIDARLDELKSEQVADERELLEFLTAAMRGLHTEFVVTNSGKKFELPIRCAERLRACDMLCKIYGMYRRDAEDDKPSGMELFVSTLEKVWAHDTENQADDI